MNEVKSKCENTRDGVLLLGEGWNLNTPLSLEQKAIIRNQAKIPQIAQFNDHFRDNIKGSSFNLFDKGYCLGNDHYFEAAGEAITGSIGFNKKDTEIFKEPFQSVNYIECHDNHTMWDKITSCLPDTDDAIRMKYHRLATGIVILSQGIPFLHSGQEFFRTKYGEGNSYRSPDSINQLDWDRKSQYKENVNYIKELIQIRKILSCFRMQTTDDILSHTSSLQLPQPIIGYLYQNKNSDFHEVILLCNPLNKRVLLSIPEGDWCVFADHENVGISTNRLLKGGEISIEPISLMVLGKN
jgi:pullulanase